VPAIGGIVRAGKMVDKALDAGRTLDRGRDASNVLRGADGLSGAAYLLREKQEIEFITKRLNAHFETALKTWRYTPAQDAVLKVKPGLSSPFKGERIHAAFRSLVRGDPQLEGLVKVFTPGKSVPDVRYVGGSFWWEITTEPQMSRHITKYATRFGDNYGFLLY